MKIISRIMTLLVLVLFAGCAGQTGGGSTATSSAGKALAIVKPATLSNVSSPLQVCMATSGYTVEPAKKGVNPGKGHHHLIIDEDIPADLSKPVAKDDTHIHMGETFETKMINGFSYSSSNGYAYTMFGPMPEMVGQTVKVSVSGECGSDTIYITLK